MLPTMTGATEFPPGAFRRIDEEDDARFYATPRKVVHIDSGAIAALGKLYAEILPPTGALLDLMASWRSHLPQSFRANVIGLGLNREEMADNPQLVQGVIHDLNRDPRLPFADAVFDGAMCAVSVQYLVKPVEVFNEVRRALKHEAPFVVSFSNRCFPDKVVALWHVANNEQHTKIVAAYFRASGGWDGLTADSHTPHGGDPLYAVWALKAPV
jgi:SAM-dependent methyltransferase